MFQEQCSITKNTQLNKYFYHLAIRSSKLAKTTACGQFVFIRITDEYEPLLRRPFSVAWVLGGEINIVYKIVGKGTALLAEKEKGDVLDVMGPLGNGFSHHEKEDVLLVAGGIGIASLIALMKMCRGKNVRLLYGARKKDEFISSSFLHIAPRNITYVTENGSKGKKGLVTNVLKEYLGSLMQRAKGKEHRTARKSTMPSALCSMPYVYTCGPLPMIRQVVKIAKKYRVQGEANLEERMACGVGACLGCATETKNGIKYVCKDGPVFTFEELV